METEIDSGIDSLFYKMVTADELYLAECSARADRLVLLAEIDESAVWKQDGYASMNLRLVAEYGVSQRTASEWLRVGHALRGLPEIRARFRRGELSWDKVKAATRLATPESDTAIADEAIPATAAELGRRARTFRRRHLEDAHRDRYLSWWWDDAQPVLHIEGRLPDDQGVVVAKALDLLAQERLPDPRFVDSDIWESYEARSADALYRIASQAVGAEASPDMATIVLRVDARDLVTGVGGGKTLDGPSLLPDTILRFACDCRVQYVLEDPDGVTVGIGRVSRSIPPWLRRQVLARDKGCRFPGCERTRWVQIHHIIHWAHGGATDLHNLITLCGFHHRLIHESGWSMAGSPNMEITWVRPNGEPHTPRPPGWTPTRRRQMSERAKPWLPHQTRGSAAIDTS